jgi:hypothetical protein
MERTELAVSVGPASHTLAQDGLARSASHLSSQASLAPPQPSITSMVSNLRTSIQSLEERLHTKSARTATLESAPSGTADRPPLPGHSSIPEAFLEGTSAESHAPSRRGAPRGHSLHGEVAAQQQLYGGFGKALASAVTRAMDDGRFGSVRDSLNGEALDSAARPPRRPLADARNLLTVCS